MNLFGDLNQYDEIIKNAREAARMLQEYQQAFESPLLRLQEDVAQASLIQVVADMPSLRIISEIAEQQYKLQEPFRQALKTWNTFLQQNMEQWNVWLSALPTDEDIKLYKLYKHGWVITPTLIQKGILKDATAADMAKSTNAQINSMFLLCFQKDNWKLLQDMIEAWKGNPYFTKRMKIFSDALSLLQIHRPNARSNPRLNVSLFIVPTLIAQIEGITADIAADLGFVKNDRHQWIHPDIEGKVFGTVDWINHLEANSPYQGDYYAAGILIEFLFSYAENFKVTKKNKRKEVKRFEERPEANFIRNYILHGVKTDYGKIDHVLRLFLILDFLAAMEVLR